MWRFPGSLTAGHGDAHCDVDAAAGEAGPGMACAGVDPGLVVADEACLSSEDEGVSRRWLLGPAEAEGPDRHLVATRQRGGPDGEGPGGPFMESRGDLSLLGHIQPARQVDGAGPAARALYL